MNRQQMIWGSAAAVIAFVAISGALRATQQLTHDTTPPAKHSAPDWSTPSSQQKSAIPNMPTTSITDFRKQLKAFATQRGSMSIAERQESAQHLITQLQHEARTGSIDPHSAAGLADLLWPDAEPDSLKRIAHNAALHTQLRDLAMSERMPSPTRERRDQEFAAQGRRIIAEVTAGISDREQQHLVLEQRLGELRKQIYGSDAIDPNY